MTGPGARCHGRMSQRQLDREFLLLRQNLVTKGLITFLAMLRCTGYSSPYAASDKPGQMPSLDPATSLLGRTQNGLGREYIDSTLKCVMDSNADSRLV